MSVKPLFLSYEPDDPVHKQSEEVLEYLKDDSKKVQMVIGKKKITLTPKTKELFKEILSHLDNNDKVLIYTSNCAISTQKAADMLNVSRPFLIKLLDSGEIPSSKVGKHRRVLAKDVQKYKMENIEKRKEALRELVRLGQKNKMGY